MSYCPKCENFLFADSKGNELKRICRTCGYEKADESGGLVMETIVQERSSEGYKILLNEFTRQDPTLPHVTTLPCPNAQCKTQSSAKERDVIIIKYDNQNMKFIYICNVCGTQWRSRS
jgi:DNA-directed RNA polymerase subunit M/transcription elongation factor TFIIS